MATINWTGNGTNTLFNNGANWSTGTVPGAGDAAVIDPSIATSIYIDADTTVGALTMASDVDFIIGESASSALGFTIGATGAAATFSNAGTFALNSFGPAAELVVGGTKLTLSGTGTLLLSDATANVITGATATSILNNTGNLIEGSGQLGDGTLTFINGATGVVDADGFAGLVLNTGTATVTNSGLLEATGSGSLTIDSNVNNGATGKISATGGNVYASGETIGGGTLSASAGNTILLANSTLDGTTHELTLDLNVAVTRSTNLSLLGSIANTGTIAMLASGGYGTNLYVGPGAAVGTVTLTGSGAITMSSESNNSILAGFAGDTLVNLNNTISGAGQIGNGGALALVNDATIDATALTALVIDTTATITNTKLIEATGRGGLVVDGTVQNAKGTILAAGSVVTLQNTDIVGGVLEGSGGGYIQDTSSLTLDATKGLTNKAVIEVAASSNVTLLGTLTNAGTILLAATGGYGTSLYAGPGAAAGTTTLSGSGALLLSDDTNNYVLANFAGDTLVNLNNTISGAGIIGNGGSLTLINDATIDASGNNALTIDPALAVTNNKLIEATGRGGLDLTGIFDNGTAGTISAAGGVVTLSNADIAGGTLTQSGLGVFYDASSLTLDSTVDTMTSDATIIVDASSELTLLGTLANAGTISLAATRGYGTDVYVGPGAAAGTMTLSGSGTVMLSDETNNTIEANFAGDTLVNLNNVIVGAGTIGSGATLNIVNDATIDANGIHALVIDAGTLTNASLIESTGTGGVLLDGTISNAAATLSAVSGAVGIEGTLDNAAGTISLAGGDVYLGGYPGQNAVAGTIAGGTLEASGSGSVVVTGAGGTLDGTADAVSSNAKIVVDPSADLTLLGTISNAGTIDLAASAGYGVTLYVGPGAAAGTTTLTGSGVLTMSDEANNVIQAGFAGDTLVNLNNTIAGVGQIGNGGALALINDGTIDATGINALVVDTTATITNTKLIEATGRGGLLLDATVQDAAGTILAAGSIVTLQNADIVGGLLEGSGGGYIVDSSNLILDAMAGLTNKASVEVAASSDLTLLGTLTNAGTILLAATRGYGTDLSVGPDTAPGTMTLTGSGALTLSDETNNYIQAGFAGDTLVNVNNTISGAGIIGNGGSLTLINDATINANGNNALTIDPALAVINTRLIEATGRGGLDLTGTFENGTTGTIAAAGGVVYLSNTDIVGGVLTGSGLGAFYDASSLTLDASAAALTNKATLIVNASSDLTLLGTLTNAGTIATGATRGYGTQLFVGPAAAAGTVTLAGSGALTLSDETNNYILAGFAGDTLVNLNNTISGAGIIGNGGSLTLINDGTINANATNILTIDTAGPVTNAGLLEATGSGGLDLQSAVNNASAGTISVTSGLGGGALSFIGAVTNAGTIDAASGLATISQAVTGSGTLAIGATGTLDLQAGAGAGQSTDFLASTGTLDLSNPLQFLGPIAGFGGSDVINLEGTFETGYSFANGTLTLTDNNVTVASLQFSGSYTQQSFSVGLGHAGTVITFS
jgi:hypothetical protein